MPTIVCVHGIAQQFTDRPTMQRAWMDALRGGLENAGYRPKADAMADADMDVAFFGDLFRPPGAMGLGHPPYTVTDLDVGPERETLALLYEAAVARQPSLGPVPGALGPKRAPLRVMLTKLARSKTLSGIAEWALVRDLKQVNQFLDAPAVKELVLTRIHRHIEPDTRILVGHSLGSVAAYEYLCRFRPPEVELFVTLGSPLGIPNLVFDRLTPKPVGSVGQWPGLVGTWVNVADDEDIVALTKQLAELFPGPGETRIVDLPVVNGDRPHAFNRYLNSRQVGAAIAAVL